MDQGEIDQFGATFQQFLEHVVHEARRDQDTSPLFVDQVRDFLEVDPLDLPVVTENFRPFEHATVQLAIERLLERPGVRHELIGIGGGGREHESFSEMLAMSRRHRAFHVSAPDYVTVPISVDEEKTCVRFGVYLIDDGTRRLVALLRAGMMHEGPPRLEVLASSMDDARAWLSELRNERDSVNLLRGQVLSFEPKEYDPGASPIRFHRRPDLLRDDVVLPAGLMERIERQVVGVARHRERLAREGRHLKRGVLLYGPPGTGKTHTVRYLTGALNDFTVVLLAGPAIAFVSEACALARSLQPALVVLEDVDLVAEDRSYGRGGQPLLFTVLDQMDGLAGDADVCFLLTTNRADLLETALAQRPGRVDLAAEIPLPDGTGRRRLLGIYGGGIDVSDDDFEAVVERTYGVPASFIKELTRRATLLAADRESAATTATDLHAAVDELLNAQEVLTRRLLGAGGGDERQRERPPDTADDHDDGGWFMYPGESTPSIYRR